MKLMCTHFKYKAKFSMLWPKKIHNSVTECFLSAWNTFCLLQTSKDDKFISRLLHKQVAPDTPNRLILGTPTALCIDIPVSTSLAAFYILMYTALFPPKRTVEGRYCVLHLYC